MTTPEDSAAVTPETEPIEVFGIAVMAPKQKPQADKHCFGDCGKISMAGAISDPLTGGLFVCCQKECPHEESVVRDYGSTMSFGKKHIVHIRILRDEATAQEKTV